MVVADRRHRPEVLVAKRHRLLAAHAAQQVRRRRPAFLDRGLGDAGQPATILRDGGEIAHHEDFRMAGNRQVGLDEHASRPVERRPEPAGERRHRHAGRPQDGARRNPPRERYTSPHRIETKAPGSGASVRASRTAPISTPIESAGARRPQTEATIAVCDGMASGTRTPDAVRTSTRWTGLRRPNESMATC